MKKGDFVLVPFPFTDLSGSKIRPALVLIETEFDITAAFVSTQLRKKRETDLLLLPSAINNLKSQSVVQLNKIVTLKKQLILGKLGSLDAERFSELDSNLMKLLQINIKL